MPWLTYTLIYVPFSAGLVWMLARAQGLVSRLLSAGAFQRAAALIPFAFLIHRQVLHYCEDLYKLASGRTIHPLLLTLIATLLTVLFSLLYRAASKKKAR